MHVIHCLGSMIMVSNQHYRWVLEVKFYWRYRSNQMSEHKTKDTISILKKSRIGSSL